MQAWTGVGEASWVLAMDCWACMRAYDITARCRSRLQTVLLALSNDCALH